MNKRTGILAAVAVAVLAVCVWQAHRVAWDWAAIGNVLRGISWPHYLGAILAVYAGMPLRGMRWAVLMRPQKRVAGTTLIGPQLVGFSAVALFGRIADLTRPALIARRTKTPVAAQVGVYSVERIFDLAAVAVLFSVTLLFAPKTMPHHAAILRAGVVATAATVALVIIAVAIRFAGARISQVAERLLRPASEKAATFAAARVLDFREGLRTVGSARDLFEAAAYSLLIWAGIAASYVLTARAFPREASLAGLSVAQAMLLMATSLGSSLLQVPVLGWFTQVGLVAAALHGLLDVPVAPALGCAIALLFSNTLGVVPAGMVAARSEGTTLRAAAEAAE